MKGSKSILIVFLALLTGCAVGPNYQTPQVALPSKFSEESKEEEFDQGALTSWWTTFNDPLLDVLVHEAISHNFDLQVALEKVNEVRALYQIEAAELYPKIDMTAEERRTRVSQTLFDTPFLGPPVQNFYQVGFDASWEIDIFGKRRRNKEAAFYEYEAEIESARDVYITLLSEIAREYIAIRTLQNNIHLTEREIYVQTELLSLSSARFDAGLVSEVSVQDNRKVLAENQAVLPPLKTALKQAIFRLSVLIGKAPDHLESEFEDRKAVPLSYKTIPVGLPSELLRRRPDIRQAERTLAAATAQVGSAIADLFPRFSLNGSYGFASSRAENWLKAQSRTWSLGPTMEWPILYFGRIRANIRAQNSKQEQALLTYEQAILNSLEDVESALIAYHKEEDRLEAYKKQVEATQRTYALTRDLYLSGLSNFSDLLEADREVILAESNLLESTQSLSTNLVALYKALGGEWE